MKRFLYVVSIFLLAVSCGSDNPASLTGTYALQSVSLQGNQISYTATPPDITGTLTLTENRYTVAYAISAFGIRHSDAGTFQVFSTTISLTSESGGTDVGAFSPDGRQITFTGNFVNEDEVNIEATLIFVKS